MPQPTLSPPPAPGALPWLSQARLPPTRAIEIVDERGERRAIQIPDERPLTVFVDRRELVTLMTLGSRPELLVLGYLLNQGLVAAPAQVESVTVDWEVAAAAVKLRTGIADFEARTARRVVTTGCGQGTVFGEISAGLDALVFASSPPGRVSQRALQRMLAAMRELDSVYRMAGSVHGTALWPAAVDTAGPLFFVEDVGRHNAVDTVAGWMAMARVPGGDKLLYTTGRLTSEMVMKAARIGVPMLVSRNGVTAMGLDLARRLGMALLGRAANHRFLCYCGAERLDWDATVQASA